MMDLKALKIDKAIHAGIPPLTEHERQQLKENIERDGCRDALIVWKGKGILLDGRNRREICLELGKPARVVELEFEDELSARVWVLRQQRGRRNLTPMQLVEIALSIESLLSTQAQARRKSGKPDPAPNLAQGRADDVRDAIANEAGVSHGTVGKVQQIIENAADPVKDMARAGEVSVDAASLISQLPEKQQEKIAAKGPKAVKEKAAELRKKRDDERAAKKSQREAAKAAAKASKLNADARDEVGQPIPEGKGLRDVFAARGLFDEALNTLTQLTAQVNRLTGDGADKLPRPGGEFLVNGAQKIAIDVKNIRSAINFARPYALCPYPHDKSGKCRACHGGGWVTKGIYDSAPREYRKGVAKCA